jgi:hypothetical protein
MFKPKYRILLTSKYFPQDKVIGLGTQLILIINSIKKYLLPHTWYGADVEAVGKAAKKYNLNGMQLNIIGSDLQFINYCSEIDQFIWGDFLCIDDNFISQDFQNIKLITEDKSFRSINVDGILIEIRAFDTTYFEIYSENEKLMAKVSKTYDVKMEKAT